MVPQQIEIGGKSWGIKVERQTSLSHQSANGQNDLDHLEILIVADHPEVRAEMFLHEWMEGVNHVWLDRVLEHNQVNAIGEALLQLFKQLGISLEFTKED